ncbi:MAG: TetR/AcrR family transcriptional regulator [Gammaproteobacteria bacterium]|jgi:TetR/AcrR family transcriptional repressor of nem operon|nr:TetR/AcrR family transcriptional regulator [Gammaproteobacteria bacterium]
MPRPIEYDRDEVLQKATELFWYNGYEQTSVRDVLNATGFNRHSLYEEFGGKAGLFKASLEYYKQHIASGMVKALQSKDAGLETIREIFKARAEIDQQELGCLISNTLNNKHTIGKELFSIAKAYNKRVEKALHQCISNAQRKGEVAKEKDTKLLARYVMTIFHGLGPMSKNGISRKETVAIGEMTINLISAK